MLKIFIISATLLLSLLASKGVLAQFNGCIMVNPGWVQNSSWPDPIIVDSASANGTVLATLVGSPNNNFGTFVSAAHNLFANCTVGWYVSGAIANGGTWNTNVPGVGLRVTYGSAQVNGSGTQQLRFPQEFYTASMQLELIKTGSVTSTSTLNPINYYYNCSGCGTGGGGGPDDWYGLRLSVSGVTVQPAAPTCSLSTSSATFNMGSVLTTAFTGGPGSHQEWVANQSLVSGGCNASTVSMTFAGTAAGAPYSNAFANAGTATGVALELWQAVGSQAIPNSSTPINFTPQGAGGRYTFQARYIQTASTVTAGSVNATVTVTVNYK
ncbi:hypothetical protein EO087_12995 [Dyella sp. M7H15-1]|uniref:fimbrial protein n=1 Tax=Dyella sp. M7H15-1 TaxID=2501295 RepID=UPI001004F025|nr:fimbrial protein [Dyella sp. M7H15-1]QAU24790.1 hypothetical protein EO087_12995 [Dyella sp. M7H15-1]